MVADVEEVHRGDDLPDQQGRRRLCVARLGRVHDQRRVTWGVVLEGILKGLLGKQFGSQ